MALPDLPSPTPSEAWRLLAGGNARFVAGATQRPHHSAWRRRDVAQGQHPFATVLGCADSRVPPELVFDRGLGDIFTVRTAGHVVDTAAAGTIEYGVSHCGTPLLAVIGHEACGAVAASIVAGATGEIPGGHIGSLVEAISPSVRACTQIGVACAGEVMEEHVRQTVQRLVSMSTVLSAAVETGELAVVGLTYRLADGRIDLLDWVGDLGHDPAAALDPGVGVPAAIVAQDAATAAVLDRAGTLVAEPA